MPIDSYPQIAVASTFSPRYRAVLAETCRIADYFQATISVVHASQPDESKAARFQETLTELGIKEKPEILWADTESTPAEAIVSALRQAKIPLLVAGAIERHSEHRHFLGSVARELMSIAPCDLFLLTHPSETPEPFRTIVVDIDAMAPEDSRFSEIRALAKKCGAEQIILIANQTPFNKALEANSGQSKLERLDLAASLIDGCAPEIETRLIESNTGFATCEFVQGVEADLFVVGTESRAGIQRIPHYMDWLIQVIPTNLWLVGP